MLSIPVILLSLIIIFKGKMPLYGGQTIQGNKVRLTGLAMLTLSVISLFISSKIGLLLIFLAIIPMAVLYLFGKAEEELQ